MLTTAWWTTRNIIAYHFPVLSGDTFDGYGSTNSWYCNKYATNAMVDVNLIRSSDDSSATVLCWNVEGAVIEIYSKQHRSTLLPNIFEGAELMHFALMYHASMSPAERRRDIADNMRGTAL